MLSHGLNNLAVAISDKYSQTLPLFVSDSPDVIKAELKPYLQPFERELALRELTALVGKDGSIEENHGLYLIKSNISEVELRRKLTYWQRLGRELLVPTLQKSLEFTQNGMEKANLREELHNARRLRYGPHDLHEYRGKFFPQLVRSIINISMIADDALVIDPMSGSGTTLCEALASGRSAIGADLNPLSVLISDVKAGLATENPDRFLSEVDAFLELPPKTRGDPKAVWNEDDLLYLERWFDAAALFELSGIVSNISSLPDGIYRKFFLVCLSNVIRELSWQKDTDLRARKDVRPYASGSALKAFRSQILSQRERIYPYLCVLQGHRTHSRLAVRHGNAVAIDKIFPDSIGKCDLLVTSPPYATALPYLDTDRLSLIVLGLLDRKSHREIEFSMVGTREVSEKQRQGWWDLYIARRKELPQSVCGLIERIAEANHQDGIGFRRRNLPALLGKYFLDMLSAMSSARKMMKPGSSGYYVVGNNSTMLGGAKVDIPTDKLLFELGQIAGWRAVEMIPMELIPSRDIFRENRGSTETILHFKATTN